MAFGAPRLSGGPSTRRAARSLGAALGVAIALGAASARADEVCLASSATPASEARDDVLAEAKVAEREGRSKDARALLAWQLARMPADVEAKVRLARLDAWDGCFGLAQASLRGVLAEHPGDVDARAVLVDVLSWQARWDDAIRILDAGLGLDASAVPLLVRKAKLLRWRGDAGGALDAAARARAIRPDDDELRALEEQLYASELRGSLRYDRFPAGSPSLRSTTVEGLQRFGSIEARALAQLLEKPGGGDAKVVDGRYGLAAFYHPTFGVTAGLELALGAPASAVPDVAGRASVEAPLFGRFSGRFAYSLWHYRDEQIVHLFAPALGFTPNERLQLELRYWASYVVLPPPPSATPNALRTKLAHSAGPHATVIVSPRLTIGAGWVHGTQVDQNPSVYQLVSLTSDSAYVFATVLIDRRWGLAPALAVERRAPAEGDAIWIESAELGILRRW